MFLQAQRGGPRNDNTAAAQQCELSVTIQVVAQHKSASCSVDVITSGEDTIPRTKQEALGSISQSNVKEDENAKTYRFGILVLLDV